MNRQRVVQTVVTASATVAAAALVAGSVFGKGPSVARDEIGPVTAGGMKIEPELEKAQTMQMLMGGEWMLVRPAKGDTHHFEVALVDPKFGGRIPYARVSATFLNLTTKGSFAKRLDPMYGDNLHYGANVRLATGDYKVTVRVQPPSLMREGEALNRWLKPIKAEFKAKVTRS